MASDEEDQDTYVAQLKAVFKSCDTNGIGYLDRRELRDLCHKLQLEDQAEALIQQLMEPGSRARVGFEEFKEGFVAVLSESVDELNTDDDDLPEYDELSYDDLHVEGHSGSSRRNKMKDQAAKSGPEPKSKIKESSSTEEQVSSLRVDSKDSPSSSPAKSPLSETYEADGEFNHSMSSMENSLGPSNEEQHLRDIWKELGVGQQGALSIRELDTVCQHIGMEEMTSEELQQLFEKLDVDRDGKVGFHEFLNGLFQHGAITPTPSHPAPTPRPKLHLTAVDDRSLHSPTCIGSTGIFSSLEGDTSGYVHPDTIIQLWDTYGLPQGADILEYLQFNINSNVSLAELSRALVQEVHSVEEDNAVYRAAIASYEHEIKFLKSNNEHLKGERDKFSADLVDANHRISMLVAEGDERQSTLEQSRDEEIRNLEQKYQNQLKAVQAELERERDSISSISSTRKNQMQEQIDKLKIEESLLKAKLSATETEVKRLSKELSEAMDKCNLLERQNSRQKLELESNKHLQVQLEEMESHTDSVLDAHQKLADQKIHTFQAENKVLKDRVDELMTEVSDLQQQLLTSRRQLKNARGTSSDKDSSCSLLSEYVKPFPAKTNSEETNDGNDTEDDNNSVSSSKKIRRKLPQAPDENAPEETRLQYRIQELQREKNNLLQKHSEEINRMQQTHSKERKDSEASHQKKMAEIEEGHKRDILQLKEKLLKEKDNEFKLKLKEALATKERELQQEFENESQTLLNSQKSRLEEEHRNLMDATLKEERDKLNKQLEAMVSRDRSYEEMKRQKMELESRLQLQKEEMELEFKKERLLMREKFEEERSKLEDKHRLEVYDYENMFIKGAEGLRGQLKKDFFTMLDRHKAEVVEQERLKVDIESKADVQKIIESHREEMQKLIRKHEADRRELIRDYEAEKSKISDLLAKERMQVEKKYKAEIADLENILEEERDNFSQQRDALLVSHSRERNSWQRKQDIMKQDLEEEIASCTQARLEEEFVDQIERIKAAYDEERSQLEDKLRLLQTELEEASDRQHSMDSDSTRQRRQIEELRQANISLRAQSEQLEQRCSQHAKEIERLKALQAPVVSAAAHVDSAATNVNDESTILTAIDAQKHLIIEKTSELKLQISNLNQFLHGSLAHEEKTPVQEHPEVQILAQQLEEMSEKLGVAEASLKLAESSHVREVQMLRDQLMQAVDETQYKSLQNELRRSEATASQLRAALERRSAETNKLLSATCEEYRKALDKAEAEKKERERQLMQSKSLLEEQVNKLKHQMEKSAKTDLLVKDLYVENAQLIKALEMTERRQKAAESKVFSLQDKYTELNKVLRMVCPAALG